MRWGGSSAMPWVRPLKRILCVLDGAVALFCAVGGVQPQSEQVWKQSEKYGVPTPVNTVVSHIMLAIQAHYDQQYQ